MGLTTESRILEIFLVVSFYVIYPALIIFILIPNLLFRATVKRFDHGGGYIVPPLSNLFAVDQMYSHPTSTLLLGSIYKGRITKDLICNLISEQWLKKRDTKGSLLFPELQMTLHSRLGYSFWKQDRQFNVLNHIKFLEVSIHQNNISKLFVELVNQPFKRHQSPWEIIIIPNLKQFKRDHGNIQSLVLFKIHHCLVDGFSIMMLGQQGLGLAWQGDTGKTVNFEYRPTKLPNFALNCAAALKIPYFLAKSFMQEIPSLLSTKRKHALEQKQVKYFAVHEFDLLKLKQVKNKHKVSLTSVLLCGYAAAVRNFLGKTEVDLIPPSCMLPVPLPGHPEKLGNHMSFVVIKLPVHENDPFRRLMMLHRELESAKESLDPLCMQYVLSCVASLPSFVVDSVLRNCPVPFLLSNFPGPIKTFAISGHHCSNIFFNGGLLQGNLHTVFTCVAYDGKATLAVSSDSCILKNPSDTPKFLDIILNEIECLGQL